MSDQRIRALEQAVARGDPGAAEALARAQERIAPCARCNGSGLVVDPAKVREVQSGKWDHHVATVAFSSGLWAIPCTACRRDPRVDPVPGDVVQWIRRLGPRRARRERWEVLRVERRPDDEPEPVSPPYQGDRAIDEVLVWARETRPDEGRAGENCGEAAWSLRSWRHMTTAGIAADVLRVGSLVNPPPEWTPNRAPERE